MLLKEIVSPSVLQELNSRRIFTVEEWIAVDGNSQESGALLNSFISQNPQYSEYETPPSFSSKQFGLGLTEEKISKPQLGISYKSLRIKVELPKSFDLRSSYHFNALNQGKHQICVASATCGIIKYLYENAKLKMEPSQVFAYRAGKDSTGSDQNSGGMPLHGAIAGMIQYGICPDELWHFDPNQVLQQWEDVPKKAILEAKRNKVMDYECIESNIEETKQSLFTGVDGVPTPVLFGMAIHKDAFFNSYTAENGKVFGPRKNDQLLGYHAMDFIGWDDEKEEFIVLNSWGNYGDNGFLYIGYNHFKEWGLEDTLLPVLPNLKKVHRAKSTKRIVIAVSIAFFSGLVVRSEEHPNDLMRKHYPNEVNATVQKKESEPESNNIEGNLMSKSFGISSPFGIRRNVFNGNLELHQGIDIPMKTGTLIYPWDNGTVKTTGIGHKIGKYIILRHANGLETIYGHLSKIAVKKGDAVIKSTNIGISGNTGCTTGPHLHLAMKRDGRFINPLNEIAPQTTILKNDTKRKNQSSSTPRSDQETRIAYLKAKLFNNYNKLINRK